MEKFKLLLHPTLEEVKRQKLASADEPLKRYGVYKVRVPGVSYTDSSLGETPDIVREFFIAPDRIVRIDDELGRVSIEGSTSDGVPVKVDIDPLLESDSRGTIELGE